MKKIYVVMIGLFLIFLQGCGEKPVTNTPVPTSAISNVESFPSPSPTPSGPIPIGTLLDKNLSLRVVHPTEFLISHLAIGSNNEVFAIGVEGDTIYQLMDNGEFVEHMRFPGKVIDYFNIAPDGTLWFVNKKGWGLYHVVNGRAQQITSHMNRLFDFDSAGSLFAVDQPSDGVQKITPDGMVEVTVVEVLEDVGMASAIDVLGGQVLGVGGDANRDLGISPCRGGRGRNLCGRSLCGRNLCGTAAGGQHQGGNHENCHHGRQFGLHLFSPF